MKPENEDAFTDLVLNSSAEFSFLGVVDGNEMIIDGDVFGKVDKLKEDYDSAIGKILE